MLQEKIKNYIKQRECATARIKTLLRQPCPVTFTTKQEFSPHKTIHQFQPIKNVNKLHSVLKMKRNLSRQRSPSLKFDQVITNGVSNIVRRNENRISMPQLKQRTNDVNLQTQFTTLPTHRQTQQWFGKSKRSQSYFVTLSTLFDDDIHQHKQRISKNCFMENRLNENQFVMTDFSPVLNI